MDLHEHPLNTKNSITMFLQTLRDMLTDPQESPDPRLGKADVEGRREKLPSLEKRSHPFYRKQRNLTVKQVFPSHFKACGNEMKKEISIARREKNSHLIHVF